MQAVTGAIEALFHSFSKATIHHIYKLPQSGGDREYFRIETSDGNFIATNNQQVKENQTFLYFSDHFKKAGAPVPAVLAVNQEQTVYIQQDLGDISLLQTLETQGRTAAVFDLYKQSLRELAQLQIKGDEGLDYERCITSKEFGKQAIISDLLYFKYYFLDILKIPYDKEKLMEDIDALSTYLAHVDYKYFMFRDFQSRNIMVQKEAVYFIDYQGGMKGALQYDVASLLWQAKAELSDEWKTMLLYYYMDCVENVLNRPLDRIRFESQYNGYVLIRLLQVLGAYGFRGLFERKAHFLTSIPLALRNLQWFLEHKQVGIGLPELESLLTSIVQENIITRFEPERATLSTPLVVKVNSFSYKKSGYPTDDSGNGGGFVFDCRGILNPGRFEEFKTLTGRDKPVKDFLEQQTQMSDFLNGVYTTIDISVEDYLKRGFSSLMISFGCTGGQHRSVYAADAVVRYLRNKYGVKTALNHIEQNIKEFKS